MGALAQTARRLAQPLVHARVAVIVLAIAGFVLSRVDVVPQGLAVARLHCRVEGRRRAQAGRLAEHTVPVRIQVEIEQVAARSAFLVSLPVAVVVLAVARLGRTMGHGGVEGRTVRHVRVAIVVIIEIAHIPRAVQIRIQLSGVRCLGAVVQAILHAVAIEVTVAGVPETVLVRIGLAGVRDQRAVVHTVDRSIPVVVHIEAVRLTILVQIAESLVRKAVAVVVHSVALLGDGSFQGVALLERTARANIDGMITCAHPARNGSESFVGLPVAIIVLPVARLDRTGMDCRIQGGAILIVRDLVVVIIQVARIPLGIELEVLLPRVGRLGAVVEAVQDAVAVVVRGHAVGLTIPVRVGKSLVPYAVAIVVLPVAELFDGSFQGVALLRQCFDTAFDRVLAVAKPAGDGAELFVHRTVAIVVQSVARLGSGHGRVTLGQPFHVTVSVALAGAGVAADPAFGLGCQRRGQWGACALSRCGHALHVGSAPHQLHLLALEPLGTVRRRLARAAAKRSVSSMGDAPVP